MERILVFFKFVYEQECIPVGCVPFASVAICWPGGLLHTPQSSHPPGSRHPPPRPAARHAGIPPAMHAGIPHPPGDLLQGMLGYHLPCGQTHTCKNITFATSLRTVKMCFPDRIFKAQMCPSRHWFFGFPQLLDFLKSHDHIYNDI